MKVHVGFGMCVVLLAIALAGVRAEDKPAATDAKAAKKAAGKLVQPWSRLSSLTDEQKQQIKEIHREAVAKINAIREKEEADILALLTDEQKTELKTIQEQAAAERKQKGAAAKESAGARKEAAPAH
jgi:Spy/CpxP family protein refolding chaperone